MFDVLARYDPKESLNNDLNNASYKLIGTSHLEDINLYLQRVILSKLRNNLQGAKAPGNPYK